MPRQNMVMIDRLSRGFLAAIFAVLGWYWFAGAISILLLIVAAVMILTAGSGFCPMYAAFGINRQMAPSKIGKAWLWAISALILVVLIAGGYLSAFFTKKMFIDDFNVMNNSYKQTLYYTGQAKRAESVENYAKLVTSFAGFQSKYRAYKPVSIRHDVRFDADLESIGQEIAAAREGITNGDLPALHKQLEPIRTEFQDILKRNGFSMLGMALSDFHDAMEVAVEAADAKNPAAVLGAYQEIDSRLKIVEAMANDEEIMNIRTSLESLMQAARNNETEGLPKKGSELKSSFIKVYLKRS